MKGLLLALLCMPALAAADFEFQVRHHHVLRDCRGTLKISAEGVQYQTDHKGDSRQWKYPEIRVIEVRSETAISIVTYEDQRRLLGKDRVFEFTLLQDRVSPQVAQFLQERTARPMRTAVFAELEKPVFEVAAKHLHTISGAMGVLRVYPDRIVFHSAREGDSRLWRLADIQRFSQPDRFRFQIVSYIPKGGGPTEVYNLELQGDLPEGLYDYLWVRLHPSSYYPAAR